MGVKIKCAVCGKEMALARCNIDSYGNITVNADPCEDCTKDCTDAAEARGYENGEKFGREDS